MKKKLDEDDYYWSDMDDEQYYRDWAAALISLLIWTPLSS